MSLDDLDRGQLEREIASALNRNNVDTITSTPDFILARMLVSCLDAYAGAKRDNEQWHGLTVTQSRDQVVNL